MKTIHCYLISVAAIAVIADPVGAADGQTDSVEKRIVVANEAGTAATGESSEPVTYLGVVVAPVEGALTAQLQLGDGQGLVVNFVEPGSPANEAGLRQHDVLTRLDDQVLIEPRQLSVLVRNHREGDTVTVSYLRAGQSEQVNVTLAQHVPAAQKALRWMGKGTPKILFRGEYAEPSTDIDGHPILRTPNGDFTIPRTPAFEFLRRSGANGERVTILRPQTNVVFSDDAGTLILSTDENERVLTAKDPAGNVTFEGPVDTPEQREELSEELRQRLEDLERLGVMDAPSPPAPPVAPLPPRASGITPAAPSARTGAVL